MTGIPSAGVGAWHRVVAMALPLFAFVMTAAQAGSLPTLDCVITPYAVVDVSSPVPGVLESVNADRSDQVEEGQVVAELDSGVERASLALAEARAGMDTEIQLGQVNLQFDTRHRDRLESLYSKQVLSFHDKDRAERDVALSQWRLHQARDVHLIRQLELHRAEEVVEQKVIRTPISGVVVQRFKSPGEYVEEQPILRVVQLDPLYVEAIVPMTLFGRIVPGTSAVVVPETVAATPHQATVDVVDQMGDAASGTYGVRLLLPNPEHLLPAGQKCSVRFLTGDDSPLPGGPEQASAETPPGDLDASVSSFDDY